LLSWKLYKKEISEAAFFYSVFWAESSSCGNFWIESENQDTCKVSLWVQITARIRAVGPPLSPTFYLHGDVEEDGEEKFVVDGHRDETRLVELRGRLAHADAQPNTPHQQHHLH